MVPGQADTPRENASPRVRESTDIHSDSTRPHLPQPRSLSDPELDAEHGGQNVADVAAGLLKYLERQAEDLHQHLASLRAALELERGTMFFLTPSYYGLLLTSDFFERFF